MKITPSNRTTVNSSSFHSRLKDQKEKKAGWKEEPAFCFVSVNSRKKKR